MRHWRLLLLSIAVSGLASTQASAALTSAQLVEGAKLCTHYLPHYERQYGIPANLLSAIASTESGRLHKELKLRLPWPWTINAEGKGYFFDSKEEAMAAARALRARGVQSFDVGCMQVNMYHHGKAFNGNLEQAFDPQTNIAYAASFLRSLYQESTSWKKAASDYHSRTTILGAKYFSQVYDSWHTLVTKLREAHLGASTQTAAAAPVAAVTASAEPAPVVLSNESPASPSSQPAPIVQPVPVVLSDSELAPVAQPSRPVAARPASLNVARLPEQSGKKLAAYKPVRLNSISISGSDNATRQRQNGVIVVRPEIRLSQDSIVPVTATPQAQPLVVAQALPSAEAQVVRVNHTVVASNEPARKSGPTFIFDQ